MTVVGVAAPGPWVPACAGTTVRGRGCWWGDDGCGGGRALPMGTGLRRHDGKGEGVLVGDYGCGGCRARPLGTGLRRHDGKG